MSQKTQFQNFLKKFYEESSNPKDLFGKYLQNVFQ